MKKAISSLLIILILFNFIISSYSNVYATSTQSVSANTYKQNVNASNTGASQLIESGTADDEQMDAASVGLSVIATVLGIISRILNVLIGLQIDLALAMLSFSEEQVDGVDTIQFWFTIDRCVFNRVPLLNVNYFDLNDNYSVGENVLKSNGSNLIIKESISTVYYVCRMLALIISLLTLIYIGIRMALSTVASDQARYKKMLIGWLESMIILFLLIYPIRFIINIGEMLTNVFFEMRVSILESSSYGLFEDVIRDATWGKIFGSAGFDVTLWTIVYFVLLFVEMKFFWMYIKRLFMIGLLIIVSPLITVTYSIDKAGDGKAQVFDTWLKEFTVNILIQPLHALIYLIFILSANAIAAASPLVAIALLYTLGAVEKMVKVIFNMNAESLGVLGALLGKRGKK